jgi:hypothetical protein
MTSKYKGGFTIPSHFDDDSDDGDKNVFSIGNMIDSNRSKQNKSAFSTTNYGYQ